MVIVIALELLLDVLVVNNYYLRQRSVRRYSVPAYSGTHHYLAGLESGHNMIELNTTGRVQAAIRCLGLDVRLSILSHLESGSQQLSSPRREGSQRIDNIKDARSALKPRRCLHFDEPDR